MRDPQYAWPLIALEDFCQTQSGGTPSRQEKKFYSEGTIPWIKSGELKNRYVTSCEEYITAEALENSSAKLVPKGAVLLAMYGATVGECSILNIEAATNQAICSIIPNPKCCCSTFLYYALKFSVSTLLNQRVGGAQPNISQGIIRKLKIPLPPIREQERIVEILDQADALRRQRDAANTQAKRLLPALFRQLFGDLSMNPKGYPSTTLESLIESTRNGLYKHESFYGRGTRILKMYNILDGWWNLKRMDFVEADEGEASDYAVRSGDILLNRVNTPELVGKCAVVPAELDGAVFESKNIRIRMLPTKAEPEFIWFYLNSPYGHAMLTRGMKHAIGMATVNNTDLRNTPIPLPPMAEQKIWSAHVKNIRLLMNKAEQSTTQLETLFQVLLQRAFDGRLTAKWREAHANELLREMELQTQS